MNATNQLDTLRPGHDIHGRAYAKLSEVEIGDILEADAGFPCIEPGSHLKVQTNTVLGAFVPCSCGGHTLDGQADDGEHLIGLYPVGEPA